MNKANHKNFKTAVYARVYEVQQMKDLKWLKAGFENISRFVKIDKIYLETHRDTIIADEKTIAEAKKFFEEKGIAVSGGITFTIDESNRFETYCYTNPEHRKKVKEISEYTARHFNEFILDDFFFTSCKCPLCIKAKAEQSWTDYRLKLMTEAADSLVLKPSKAVNPSVKVFIKYPNWYEHFHYLGFNLEEEPQIFDLLHTGTETRDPEHTNQHLQQYQGYTIMRYFENVFPRGNNGGWVDPYGLNHLERYGEQIEMTLLAKPVEMTLFAIHVLTEEILNGNDELEITSKFAPLAGYYCTKMDGFLGKLGEPVGLYCYRPYHSVGEDFLHNYFGMLGIPINLVPDFPEGKNNILLTQNAAEDEFIIEKIKNELIHGNDIYITSGLLKELEDNGINDIVDLRVSDHDVMVNEFSNIRSSEYTPKKILMPRIMYPTNDAWEVISAYADGNGFPFLLRASYGNGNLYVISVPNNYTDLYNLPAHTITLLKENLCSDMPIMLDAPANVSLFLYDNNTFVVHSFLDRWETVKIRIKGKAGNLFELNRENILDGVFYEDYTEFTLLVYPHSYRVFKVE